MTKSLVIKLLVIVLTVSLYFNVSQLIESNNLQNEITVQEDTIQILESTQQSLISRIEALENNQESEPIATCNKAFSITIIVLSEDDDLYEEVPHCTNEVYLGDAIDEIQEELELFYDPRYDKDYQYGRMPISFYNVTAQPGEYYQITIDGVYSQLAVDFIVITTDTSYEFTLVRWQ